MLNNIILKYQSEPCNSLIIEIFNMSNLFVLPKNSSLGVHSFPTGHQPYGIPIRQNDSHLWARCNINPIRFYVRTLKFIESNPDH